MKDKRISPVIFLLLLNGNDVSATPMVQPDRAIISVRIPEHGTVSLDCSLAKCALKLKFPNLRVSIPESALTTAQEIYPWTLQVFSNIDGFNPRFFSVQISVACRDPKGGLLCYNSVTIKDGAVETIVPVERRFNDQ